ncbi:uncharacterized protein [Argopecten irradians]|uniref:uncharacterized protein n=1 Tax=Argopecten irradians TaxID=31199 RepID=UPI003722CEF1
MPKVFGVEVAEEEDVDWDWDAELIDNTTGKKVFELSHQYIPPEQLFPSFSDGPCLLSCDNCATVMRVEELIQIKREYYPRLDVSAVFHDMRSAYRSEIVPICYTCMQTITGMPDTSCPPQLLREEIANDALQEECPHKNSWKTIDVKKEEKEEKYVDVIVPLPTNTISNVGGMVDSGVEMDDSDTSSEDMADEGNSSREGLEDTDAFDETQEDDEMSYSDTSCQDMKSKKMEDDSSIDSLDEDTTYTCTICDSEFQTAEGFGKHIRTHERINAAKCPVCSDNVSPDKLYKHIERHGETVKRSLEDLKKVNQKGAIKKLKLNKCSVCSWAYRSRAELKKHKQEAHVKCAFCPKYFKDKQRCKKHALKGKCDKHRKRKKSSSSPCQSEFACPTCQKVLPSQNDLTRHLKMHITFKKCTICRSKIRSGELFKSHMRKHEIAYKESVTNPSLTSRPGEENVGPSKVNQRNCSLTLTSENQETITTTTWRQLSLQMNKKSSVKESGVTGTRNCKTSGSHASSKNITSLFMSKVNSDNILERDSSLVSNNTSSNSPSKMGQPTGDVNNNERIGQRVKRSSSEKENEHQKNEPQEEFVLQKKFSWKNTSKKIYFKKSPDILTQLANRQLKHKEMVNVHDRVP